MCCFGSTCDLGIMLLPELMDVQLEMDKSSSSISRAIRVGLLVVGHVKNLHEGSLPPIFKEFLP